MTLDSTKLAGVALLSLVSLVAAAAPASAGVEYPYCLMQGRFSPQSCTFTTLEQCKASLFANSGYCDRNPRYVAAPQVKQRR